MTNIEAFLDFPTHNVLLHYYKIMLLISIIVFHSISIVRYVLSALLLCVYRLVVVALYVCVDYNYVTGIEPIVDCVIRF